MLLLPGPVDVPDEVLKASAYVQNHRSDEFRDIVRSSSDLLNRFADSSASVITTGSGTTAVESMLYSMTSRNEGVLAVTFGEFGGRLVESLNRHGCNVKVMEKSYSDTLEPGEIADYISKNKEIKTVCLIHNETGNGTSIYNLREAAREAKNLGMKVLVDSVSGFGSLEEKANSWGIDAIASCSQKGLASVPGLGMVSISEEGLGYVLESADVPKYMDLS
ncbi:MAG TPA: aminotransferase class V-fold PLP-dependent enzyme, partial [Thermoplasmataceae archaeon]|nr:aminotransferase class V-fold PLP-dependent enzyme [Thermoplasmataceae archaeon]